MDTQMDTRFASLARHDESSSPYPTRRRDSPPPAARGGRETPVGTLEWVPTEVST